jgi:hypothetical protein
VRIIFFLCVMILSFSSRIVTAGHSGVRLQGPLALALYDVIKKPTNVKSETLDKPVFAWVYGGDKNLLIQSQATKYLGSRSRCEIFGTDKTPPKISKEAVAAECFIGANQVSLLHSPDYIIVVFGGPEAERFYGILPFKKNAYQSPELNTVTSSLFDLGYRGPMFECVWSEKPAGSSPNFKCYVKWSGEDLTGENK